jgi:hypothetical protein
MKFNIQLSKEELELIKSALVGEALRTPEKETAYYTLFSRFFNAYLNVELDQNSEPKEIA